MKYCPKVTIIIPVYNGSNFMAEAIDSALAQTYPNCEIIVVNDGSSDGGDSERIALSYGEKIRYFRKENGGVSSALNYAFTKMTGEWFSWLSHDDLYYPDKIEKQIAFLNRLITEQPEIDLHKITVRSATESIDKDGKVIRTPSYRNVPECEAPLDTIINNVYTYRLSGCSFLLPASCIQDVGPFDESIRTVSDVEYWYRLLFSGYTFYCLSNDILVKNRSHGKQVGKQKYNLFVEELENLHIRISNMLFDKYDQKIIMRKFLYGTSKRNMDRVWHYVYEKYVKVQCSLYEQIAVCLGISYWNLRGTFISVARNVFRKIKVK